MYILALTVLASSSTSYPLEKISKVLTEFAQWLAAWNEKNKTALELLDTECKKFIPSPENVGKLLKNIKPEENITYLFFELCKPKTESICSLLVKHGIQTDFLIQHKGTPLHHAAHNGCLTLVKALLNKGSNLETRSDCNATPLFYACCAQQEHIVCYLLHAGAQVNTQNTNSITPLMKAAFLGNKTITKMLLEYGAQTDLYDNDIYNTALHEAARSNQKSIIKLLLSYGVNIQWQNKNGKIAQEITSNSDIKELLKTESEACCNIAHFIKTALKDTNFIEKHASVIFRQAIRKQCKPIAYFICQNYYHLNLKELTTLAQSLVAQNLLVELELFYTALLMHPSYSCLEKLIYHSLITTHHRKLELFRKYFCSLYQDKTLSNILAWKTDVCFL